MPHTASAWKRLRKNEKRRRRNRAAAKKLKLQRKTVDAAIKSGDAAKIETEFRTTQAMLDRAADKGYIHRNKAARLKSRLVKRLRAAAAAPSPSTSTAPSSAPAPARPAK
jgi:small subunit ribosomal protein S20